MDIGGRIRQERQRQGLDMRELAKVAGIPERTLADIEREVTMPRADNLRRVSVALGCSADQFLFDKVPDRGGQELERLLEEVTRASPETRQAVAKVVKAMLAYERVLEVERLRLES